MYRCESWLLLVYLSQREIKSSAEAGQVGGSPVGRCEGTGISPGAGDWMPPGQFMPGWQAQTDACAEGAARSLAAEDRCGAVTLGCGPLADESDWRIIWPVRAFSRNEDAAWERQPGRPGCEKRSTGAGKSGGGGVRKRLSRPAFPPLPRACVAAAAASFAPAVAVPICCQLKSNPISPKNGFATGDGTGHRSGMQGVFWVSVKFWRRVVWRGFPSGS